jgi:hypothetical protein
MARYLVKYRDNFTFTLKQQKLNDSTTPMSRVLFEKLTVSQLVKKFSAFYGSRNFITVFTIQHQETVKMCLLILAVTGLITLTV